VWGEKITGRTFKRKKKKMKRSRPHNGVNHPQKCRGTKEKYTLRARGAPKGEGRGFRRTGKGGGDSGLSPKEEKNEGENRHKKRGETPWEGFISKKGGKNVRPRKKGVKKVD